MKCRSCSLVFCYLFSAVLNFHCQKMYMNSFNVLTGHFSFIHFSKNLIAFMVRRKPIFLKKAITCATETNQINRKKDYGCQNN